MLIASAIAVNCGIFFAIAALHGKGDNYLVGYKPPANLTSEEQNSTRSVEKYIKTLLHTRIHWDHTWDHVGITILPLLI